jgi:hypothetical protein
MLAAKGYRVDPLLFVLPRGYWKRADVVRWEYWLHPDGLTVNMHSWDTLTKCARHGIEVREISPTEIEVWARQCRYWGNGACPGKHLCPVKGKGRLKTPECLFADNHSGTGKDAK